MNRWVHCLRAHLWRRGFGGFGGRVLSFGAVSLFRRGQHLKKEGVGLGVSGGVWPCSGLDWLAGVGGGVDFSARGGRYPTGVL
jgi:hypothetical protein